MDLAKSFIEGFVMGAGLIIAIGAQNAFVLKQGIKNEYRAPIALFCSMSDALLIAAGISGMGFLFTQHPAVVTAVSLFGAVYLSWFSYKAFRSALAGSSMTLDGKQEKMPLKSVMVTLLSLTFLNPHVYLDTVVMLGGFGAARQGWLRPFFGFGAVSASFVWFFTLAYSGGFLAPLFKKQSAWRVLDTGIGCVMAYIAVRLCLFGMKAGGWI